MRRSITTSSTKISTLEAQLTEAQNEAQAATKKAEQMVAENTTLKEERDKKEEVNNCTFDPKCSKATSFCKFSL